MSDAYDSLNHFISEEMRMSHIYQPVMLAKLLESGGAASVQDIAKALLTYDQSQVEYYELRVKNMVGKVLTNNRGITTKQKNTYTLNGFDALTGDEVQRLIELCHEKIEQYLDKRQDQLYAHRNLRRAPVSGSMRYKVLSRAKHRCELCGISAEEKALDVDHIVPKSLGGADDESNFQALCYTCNRSKGNNDDTDFRGMAQSYSERDEACVFCHEAPARAIHENELALAFLDGYPVTEGHTLIIPKRHTADYFDLHQPELNAIQQLIRARRKELLKADTTITGFNVGVNAGKSAGQTVFHCHIHLIPRRHGDVEEPRGGVRGVIPSKQRYRL